MAQEEFTKSGELGKKIRSALGSAYRSGKRMAERGLDYTDDVFKEYIAEPLGNLDPRISNLRAAGIEFGAGLAGLPANLGRRRYYDIPTQFDEKAQPPKTEAKSVKSEQEGTPTATVSNNEIKKQDTRSIAKPVEENNEPKKLWRVMLEGGDSSKDTFFDTKEKAEAELKRMGGKGAVAGIKLPAKTAGEEEKLRDEYIFRAGTKGRVASTVKPEAKEDRLTRKLTEAGATPEQRARYMKTLSESRQRGRERAGYAEEYAALGRVPTAQEERKMASEARDRKMSNFLLGAEARKNALEKEQSFNKELNYLKRLERQQRGDQRFASALATKLAQDELINKYGGGINNSSDRRRFFQREAMDDYRIEIEARDRMRREQFKKQTDAAPEASSFFSNLVR